MNSKPELSLIVPCYNEGPTIADSILRLYQTLKTLDGRAEVIFVDDASRDGTRDRLEQWTPELPGTRLIAHPANRGRGAAVLTGVAASTAPILGYLDIDLEVDCTYLPAFLEKMRGGADLVVGHRREPWFDPRPLRAVMSSVYRRINQNSLGHSVPDTECGFKLMRATTIAPILAMIGDHGWFFDTELCDRASRAGLRIESVPVDFHRRIEKRSTVRPIRDSINQLRVLGQYRRRRG